MSASDIDVKITVTTCTVTERQAIERERAAFMRGRASGMCSVSFCGSACERCKSQAAELYPLPKVTRPRVVADGALISYRAVDGFIEWRLHSKWCRYTHHGPVPIPTPDRVKLWADLLANPTEEVDA